MTTGEQVPASVHCPRCGGLMYKPMGSSFYWHVDNNHPPCEITNIAVVEVPLQHTDEQAGEPPRGGKPKKR